MSQQETLQGLDKASQKHEQELVIELSSDRILYFLGVSFTILLAVVTKISEITGINLTCFPVFEVKASASFVKHASTYCWEASETSDMSQEWNDSVCGQVFDAKNMSKYYNSEDYLQSPTRIKKFIQWMPYAMLLEAFLFALPLAWWHFKVGAQLMGHLKFMQQLLNDIYESIKTIPAGIYRSEPYDKNGDFLNCWGNINKQEIGRIASSHQPVAHTSVQASTSSHATTQIATPVDQDTENENDEESDDGSSASVAGSVGTNLIKIQPQKNKAKQTSAGSNTSIAQNKENNSNTEDSAKSAKSDKAQSSKQQKETPGTLTTALTESENGIEMKSIPFTDDDSSEDTPLIRNTTSSKAQGINEDSREHDDTEESNSEDLNMDIIPSNLTENEDIFNAEKRNMKTVLKNVTEPDFEKYKDLQNQETNLQRSRADEKLLGKMEDRHIFSMLCFENFASLQHEPYLKSVHQLLTVAEYEQDKPRVLPLKDGIMRQFCHENNFRSCSIIRIYLYKCIFSIILSLSILIGVSFLFGFIMFPTFEKDTFLCELPHHDECFSCTLSGITNVHAAFLANWFVVTIYFALSCFQFKFVRFGCDRKLANFFENVRTLSSVALVAAYKAPSDDK